MACGLSGMGEASIFTSPATAYCLPSGPFWYWNVAPPLTKLPPADICACSCALTFWSIVFSFSISCVSWLLSSFWLMVNVSLLLFVGLLSLDNGYELSSLLSLILLIVY